MSKPRHEAVVQDPQEMRMGSPQYGRLILDGEEFVSSQPQGIESDFLVWSDDGRLLAAQELDLFLSLAWQPAVYHRAVELRSSHELLVWLAELGSARPGSGALRRGEYLLSRATGEGKVAQPPNRLVDWLYELRDAGSITFNDSDATAGRSPDGELARKELFLIRDITVTAAGRASL